MAKCIRDGKVAVLYSPGFGAGWSTWNGDEYREFLLHDETLVDFVETKQHHKIAEYVSTVYPGKHICVLGAEDLEVEWISCGTQFHIDEYDGYEGIMYTHGSYWHTA
jgi:hypothetical protein